MKLWKRILLSLVCGVAIPYLYGIALFLLFGELPYPKEPLRHIPWLPISWPADIYLTTVPAWWKHSDYTGGSILSLVVGNVLFYAIASFLVMTFIKKRRARKRARPVLAT